MCAAATRTMWRMGVRPGDRDTGKQKHRRAETQTGRNAESLWRGEPKREEVAIGQGLRVRDMCRSPIQGDAGNREFFILLQKPQG